MRRVLWVVVALGLAVPAAGVEASEPVKLIFDTDICGDCDDVLALAMIHALQSRGECELLAVTVSAQNEETVPFVEAVNRFYGRGSVPIGYVGERAPQEHGSKYLGIVKTRDDGALRFPHTIERSREAPEAVGLLRRVLAAQADGSVVMVQVGFSTNLAGLLASGPDEASGLSGRDLVAQKVKRLSIMAGSFKAIPGSDRYVEYNVALDIPAAKALAAGWPTPIVWSGFEIGIALEYPSSSILTDYGYVAHHPVSEAYIAHEPPPHNRPTWDLTSVLVAVRGDRGYFGESEPGRVTVEDDGHTVFQPLAEGRDRYLVLDEAQRGRILEALMLLSSQPPCVSAGAGTTNGTAP